MEKNNIKVTGHRGTWYVIDEAERKGFKLYLLEHEEYGDEAAWIIVDEKKIVWLEDVHNGFDDLDYVLEEGFVRTRKVGVHCPDYCDQKYIRDRDLQFWSVSDEHARAQFIHYYKNSWLRPDEYKLVKVLEGGDFE